MSRRERQCMMLTFLRGKAISSPTKETFHRVWEKWPGCRCTYSKVWQIEHARHAMPSRLTVWWLTLSPWHPDTLEVTRASTLFRSTTVSWPRIASLLDDTFAVQQMKRDTECSLSRRAFSWRKWGFNSCTSTNVTVHYILTNASIVWDDKQCLRTGTLQKLV